MIFPKKWISPRKRKDIKKGWYKFSKNPISIIGLVVVIVMIFLAILAPYITPYPEHVGLFVNFTAKNQPPNWKHLFGTDRFGRDVFTRTIFGIRFSLLISAFVLPLGLIPGIILGLVAGYHSDTWIDTVIMRVTDIFIGIPSLILALVVCSLLKPGLFNSMWAISLVWWPWYCRLLYGVTRSLRNEFFVQSAEVIGAGKLHIIFKEILPNCLGVILTKATLDEGWVIMSIASIGFLGLGAQPPTPELGTLISKGSHYLPDLWWLTVFPVLATAIIILGFNMLGDGIRDLFGVEEV